MKITDNDNYEIGRFRSESSKKGPVYPSLKPDYDNEAMLKSFGLDWTRLRQSISEAFLPSVFSLECLAASVGSIDPVPVSQREVWNLVSANHSAVFPTTDPSQAWKKSNGTPLVSQLFAAGLSGPV